VNNAPVHRESLSSVSGRRVAAVTAGLVITGGAAGAVIGGGLLAYLLGSGPHGRSPADLPLGLTVGGSFGALVGAIGFPFLCWTVLRPVPLGRSLAYTTTGTLIGAASGLLAGHPVYGGVIGFFAGGLVAYGITQRVGR
jgi:hypothetical protein